MNPSRSAAPTVLACALLCAEASSARVFPSRVLPDVSVDDRGFPAQGERLEKGLERLQGSPTIRRMEERRRKLGPLLVSFASLDSSTSPLSGNYGNTSVNQESVRVSINEQLFASSGAFIETLAHELYGHAVIIREAGPALDIGHTIDDEGFSLAAGAVAALEVDAPVNDEDRLDALTISTAAYAAEVLFTDSPSRIDFDMDEARDPPGAIAARLRELARRRLSLRAREQEVRVWRWRIEHFVKAHGADARTFVELRRALDELETLELAPHRALLDAAEPHLKDVARYLEEPEGLAFAAGMVAVSTSPYMLALDEELAALGRRVAELRAAHPKPPAAPARPPEKVHQISWSELEDMMNRDDPEHWKDAPPVEEAAPPWRIP